MKIDLVTSANIVAAHCLRTLPDSISGRLQLCEALIDLLPLSHPLLAEVCCSIAYLKKHQEANDQLLLALATDVSRAAAPNPSPSPRGKTDSHQAKK